MNIVLVEDDHHEREEIKGAILERYPNAVIETINTESDFLAALERFAAKRPDIVLIDIMLRWTDPSPTMLPKPPDASFLDAGFRCASALQEALPGVATLLYTVLDRQSKKLPPAVRYVRKSSDFRPLYDAIAELTQPSRGPGA
jgi:DNA-binding NarL/FixJ family response regulator